MPRSTTTRKQGASLESARETAPVQVQVSQHQRLYGPRSSGRGISRFLSNLSNFAAERQGVKNRELADKAQADFLSGDIDEDEDRPAYVQAINSLNGEADATSVRSAALQAAERDIQTAIEEGREWDPDAYFDGVTAELTDSPAFQDRHYSKAAGRPLLTLKAELQALGAKETARLELQEGLNSVSSWAFSQLRSPEGIDMDALSENIDVAGLTRQEGSQAVAAAVTSFLAQAQTPEDLSKVDAYVDTMSDGQLREFGDDIIKARTVASNRINQLTAEQKLALEKRQEAFKRTFWTQAHSGELSWDEVSRAVEAGDIDPEDATSFYKQNIKAQESLQKDLTKALEEEADKQFARTVIDNPTAFAGLDTKTRNSVKEVFEQDNAEASGALMQFAAAFVQAGDEAQITELRDQLFRESSNLRGYIETARELGFTPRWIKNYIGAAVDPSSPQFRAAVEVATVLESQYGDDVLSDVPNESLAKIDAYRRLRDAGLGNQQAVDLLASRSQITLTDARTALRSDADFKSNLSDAVENLVEDQEHNTGIIFDTDIEVANGPYVKDVIGDLAAVHYRSYGNAEESVEWARSQFKRSHQLIDGSWMPTKGIPQGFGALLNETRDELRTRLQSSGILGEDEDFQIMPLAETGKTGRLGIFRKREDLASGLYPLTDSEGNPIEIDSLALIAEFGKIRGDADALEGAITLERSRALHEQKLQSFISDNPIQPKQ